jgi:hypothetical protein
LLVIDVNSVLGTFHSVFVGDDADVPHVYTGSIFRAGVHLDPDDEGSMYL